MKLNEVKNRKSEEWMCSANCPHQNTRKSRLIDLSQEFEKKKEQINTNISAFEEIIKTWAEINEKNHNGSMKYRVCSF